VTAFEQLRSEGYVEGKVGAGTYVSQVLPDHLLQVARTATGGAAGPKRVRWSSYARRLKLFRSGQPRVTRAFRANLAALEAFPTTLWAQVAARRLRRASTQLLAGGEALGYRPLRQAVAEYLNASRGVKCSAEQVLIISGVQEALERAAHLLLDPGDPVWVEEPGYPGAAIVFRAVGAKVCPVPVDSEGLDLELGQRRWGRAKLIYVTPAHQFPLGVTMSLRRRLALLEWARRSRTLILEDDYDSEYRYSGRPIPALQGLDRAGSVIFAGSFNEVLFPALRLGYLVVPPTMVDGFAAGQSVSMRHAPLLDQAVLCDFITEGHFARHIRRMRELYAQRLSVLLQSSRSRLAGLLEIPSVEAGLQTVGWLAPGISAERAARDAEKHEVEVIPLSRYSSRRFARQGLLLGFAAVGTQELRRGVEQLAKALEACKR
jgi:GntR family transcriptional regulator/MocR family aminotransferase